MKILLKTNYPGLGKKEDVVDITDIIECNSSAICYWSKQCTKFFIYTKERYF